MKKRKRSKDENELWIAPRYNLKGPAGERAWENRHGGLPTSNRFLELANIALGLKKAAQKKKKAGPMHETAKKEPYLR
jgi:hypothetical protein